MDLVVRQVEVGGTARQDARECVERTEARHRDAGDAAPMCRTRSRRWVPGRLHCRRRQPGPNRLGVVSLAAPYGLDGLLAPVARGVNETLLS